MTCFLPGQGNPIRNVPVRRERVPGAPTARDTLVAVAAPKNIPDPGFAADDGSADPALAAALHAYAAASAADADGSGEGDSGDLAALAAAEDAVVAALAGARLLVPVVAVLGEVETGPGGLRQEKTSDMAVPTIQAPDGRRALPAFTSTASLAAWREDARPVAVPVRQALAALAHEGAGTLLIDLAGPAPYALSGAALRAVAGGRDRVDPLADPAVLDAVRDALGAEPGVARAYLSAAPPGAGERGDGVLGLVLAPGAPVAETAQRVAVALAGAEALRAGLVRGLDLALLPPDARPPGTPVYTADATP
jgi:hypothetical protein